MALIEVTLLISKAFQFGCFLLIKNVPSLSKKKKKRLKDYNGDSVGMLVLVRFPGMSPSSFDAFACFLS